MPDHSLALRQIEKNQVALSKWAQIIHKNQEDILKLIKGIDKMVHYLEDNQSEIGDTVDAIRRSVR